MPSCRLSLRSPFFQPNQKTTGKASREAGVSGGVRGWGLKLSGVIQTLDSPVTMLNSSMWPALSTLAQALSWDPGTLGKVRTLAMDWTHGGSSQEILMHVGSSSWGATCSLLPGASPESPPARRGIAGFVLGFVALLGIR